MKKSLLLLAILFLGIGVFSSCNKDNGGGSSSSIVGTWVGVKQEIYKDGNLIDVEYYGNGNTIKMVITETNFTAYQNSSPIVTASYQYDSSTKRFVFGMGVCWIVQKLNANEMKISNESDGEDRDTWYVEYFERE